MRSNAIIPAFMALSVVLSLPATLPARTTTHPGAHKTAVAPKDHSRTKAKPVASKKPRSAATQTTRLKRVHATPNTAAPAATPTRKKRHSRKQTAAPRETINLATTAPDSTDEPAKDSAPKKATSADFQKVAAGETEAPAGKPAADKSADKSADKATEKAPVDKALQ